MDEIDANLIEQTQKASFRGTSPMGGRSSFGISGQSFGRRINEPQQHGFRSTPVSHTEPSGSSAANRPTAANAPAVPQHFEPSNPDLLQEGMRVMHAKFGAGTILSIEGAGANKKASVRFDREGVKMLMLKFARLGIIR